MVNNPHPRGRFAKKAKGVARSRRLPGEMTKAEIAYIDHLDARLRDGSIIAWRYESLKLRLADKTFFTPDFLVQLPSGELELHEVKGAKRKPDGTYKPWAEEDARLKLKIAAEQWWQFRMVVAYQLPQKLGGVWQFEIMGQHE